MPKFATMAAVGSALLVVAVAGVGSLAYSSKGRMMSEKPPHKVGELSFQPSASLVRANLAVPYSALNGKLADLTNNLAGSERGRERLATIGLLVRDVHLDLNWEVHFGPNGKPTVRQGKVDVAAAGSAVPRSSAFQIFVPVRFWGGAGFGGAIAGAIGLGRKNFNGALTVIASASVKADENFCPIITVSDINFRWDTGATVDLIGETRVFGKKIGPFSLPLGPHINGQIRDGLAKALEGAARSIPCDPVREGLAKVWRNYSFPVRQDGMPEYHVNLSPESMSMSGVIAEPQALRLIAEMSALVDVSPTALTAANAGNLPSNNPIANEEGAIDLAVPIRVNYAEIRERAMSAVAGKTFTAETEAGKVDVVVEDVVMYPSDGRIAVGVDLRVSQPWRVFDTTGTIWLTAVPKPSEDGTTITFEDPSLTRRLDNPMTEGVTVIFAEQIAEVLRANNSFDLSEPMEDAIAALKSAITGQSPDGVQITMEDAKLGVGQIVGDDEGLIVEGLFSARWDAQLTSLEF